MIRRNTLCPSELPSTVQLFDQYFGLERSLPSLRFTTELSTSRLADLHGVKSWSPRLDRVRPVESIASKEETEMGENESAGDKRAHDIEGDIQANAATKTPAPSMNATVPDTEAVNETEAESECVLVAMTQTDGPVGAKKGKGKSKKRNKGKKHKRTENKKDEDDEEEVETEIENENENDNAETVKTAGVNGGEKKRKEREGEASEGRNEEQCSKVHEVTVVYGDRGDSTRNQMTDMGVGPDDSGDTEDEAQKDEDDAKGSIHNEDKAEAEAVANTVHCHIHGRLLCQFSEVCCVHKPTIIGCSCPPRRSCCCMHHVGDCCNCRADDPMQQDGNRDDSESKTLSIAADTPPTTPPRDGDGAEYEDTLAIQASIDLSKTLIEMVERNHMSDLRLILRSKNNQWLPIVMTVHKCVLARSPLVTSLLQYPRFKEEIVAHACENFSLPKPWELVVHYFYGRPLMSADALKPITLDALGYDPNPEPGFEPEYLFSLPAAMLDMALGYAVCGAFFYFAEIVERGFGLAMDLLCWETVEQMLLFGISMEKFAVVLHNAPWDEPPSLNAPTPSPDGKYRLRQAQIEPSPISRITDAAAPFTTNNSNPNLEPSGSNAPATAAKAAAAHVAQYPIPMLKNEWSRRLIIAALNFVVDHITPGFKLYSRAHSEIIPSRIPETLRTPAFDRPTTPAPASSPAPPQPEEQKNDARPVPTSKTAFHFTALAKSPLLANIKFGSFPDVETPETNAFASKSTPSRGEPIPSQDKPSQSPLTPPSKEDQGNIGPPHPSVTIASAILLSLSFHDLQLAFEIMAARGVLSVSLALGIIFERERRRVPALRRYINTVIARVPKGENDGQHQDEGNPQSSTGGGNGGAEGGTETPAAKKTKAKKGGKKNKKKKGKSKTKTKTQNNDQGQEKTEEEKREDKEIISLNFYAMPEVIRELCHREYFSKVVKGHKENGEEVSEIVLEREFVGMGI